jgi:dTDP-4-amino-4,6-dideoxygalactose transaminase
MKPRPLIDALDILAVRKQLYSKWLGRGVRVAELEHRMAAWVGVRNAVAFGSGTTALTVALLNVGARAVRVPVIDCPALYIAADAAGCAVSSEADEAIAVYPTRGVTIEDFARHLPCENEVRLRGRFGVFSFGALKDVTGGIGGCLVSDSPFSVWDWRELSPLSDMNAALILSQLDRYRGHTRLREVADGKVWESPS